MMRLSLPAAALLLLQLTTTSVAQPIDSAAEFVAAAGAGDTAKLTAFLAQGFNINSRDGATGKTALAESITGFRLSTTKYLLAHGADANVKDHSGATPLMLAAWRPDRRIVQDLLAAGGDPKLSDTAGYTVLSDAYDEVTIRRLVASGADVNQANHSGETAILRMATYHRLGAVLELLASGADPNRASLSGETPLLGAVRGQEPGIAQALVNGGAQVNVQDRHKMTPLMVAAGLGNLDMVSLLLAAGADSKLKDAQGKSAIEHATDSGHAMVAESIPNEQSLRYGFPTSPTMMFLAASIGDTAALVRCLDAGEKVGAVNGESGLTPLEYAAMYGQTRVIRCLIARGASVNFIGMPEREYIPLRTAVSAGHLDAVNELIRSGADVADVLSDGGGLVNVAAGDGDREMVEALIAAGAPLNVKDNVVGYAIDRSLARGDLDIVAILRAAGARERTPVAGTPNTAVATRNARPAKPTTEKIYLPKNRDNALDAQLFVAAQLGDLATVQSVLDAGAPVDAMSFGHYNATTLILAARNGQTPVVKELVSRGAEMEAEDDRGATALMAAILDLRDGTASALMKSGAGINTVTTKGFTALIAACSTGNIVMANMLLDAGADPGLGLAGKGTPLIMSVKRQNLELVGLLLAKGADVNGPGIYGMTPLVEAALARNTEIAKQLLAAGAQVDPVMTEGWAKESPLSIATSSNDKEMVKLLKKAGAKEPSAAPKGSSSAAAGAAGVAGAAGAASATSGAASKSAPAPVASTPPPDSMGNQATTILLAEPPYGSRNYQAQTNLDIAAYSGDLKAAKAALDGGALVNDPGIPGGEGTPIMRAAKYGHPKIVEELLARGALLEVEVPKSYTALIRAVSFKHYDIVKMLLAAGAKPNTITTDGTTALLMAGRWHDVDMAKILLASGADPNLAFDGHVTPLQGSAYQDMKDLAKLLLDKGASVNALGYEGLSPLATAASRNYLNVAKVLVAAGADVNLECTGQHAGLTALQVASKNGYTDMEKLLMKAGATK